jgi:hypothetical protein
LESEGGGMNNTEIIAELKTAQAEIRVIVNTAFDKILRGLSGEGTPESSSGYEIPFEANPNIFIGKKPTAVLFDGERVEAGKWTQVYGEIIGRANREPHCHEQLMCLRNKTGGKVRVFLSDKPDGMRRPHRIDEELYGETQYGSSTLMHILCKRILDYTDYDYGSIKIALKR